MRDSWPGAIEPLIISYGSALSTESGIGIVRNDDGYRLLRLEFHQSLHYSSQVEDVDELEALRVLYSVNIRVAHTSIPISESLADAFAGVFGALEAASGDEERGVVVVSIGGGMEVMLSDERCLALMPRPSAIDNQAKSLGALAIHLLREMGNWRPSRYEAFESEVFALIEEAESFR